MLGRRSVGAGRAAVLSLCLVSLGMAIAACGGAAPSVPPTDAGTASPVTAAPEGPVPGVDGPPLAVVAVDGGDPVVGQLGTYTWGDTGSDAPWLPGAPIAVGVGEVLSLTLEPAVAIESWTASRVPAGSDGPAGALTLGRGTGRASFGVPPPGEWTVVVIVVFADGRGQANYAWAVHVE